MMEVTDEMCTKAIQARQPDRIQGFSTPLDSRRREWGAPHWVLDVFLPHGEQELWRGDDQDEMLKRCEIERMRLALRAALSGS